MSTYSLSGSGTHALTASTTGLQVTITTPSNVQGVGLANPANHYHTGMLRFSDGTAYWDPVPITGGPQFIPVPQNATSFGYAMQGGAVISVTEVIGGTVFFSGGGSGTLSGLTDVLVAAPSNGQLLQWNASAGKWENATVGGAAGALTLISSNAVAGASVASVSFSGIPATYTHLLVIYQTRATGGNSFQVLELRMNTDAGAHYDYVLWDSAGSVTNTGQDHIKIAYVSGGGAPANYAASGQIVLANYLGTTFYKTALGPFALQGGLNRSGEHSGTWKNTASITDLTLLMDANNIDVGSTFSLYGVS